MARRTVNTEGIRLRSSSVNTRPGFAISSLVSVLVLSLMVISARPANTPLSVGRSTSPRAFSASIFMMRPREEMTSGGSMMAVSQRV